MCTAPPPLKVSDVLCIYHRNYSHQYFLKKIVIGLEGSSCNDNVDCKSALVCDGNLKECRQKSSHHSTDNQFCSRDGRLCQEMEGDCDHDHECAGSLTCGTDNCGSGYRGDWDCCAQPGDVMSTKLKKFFTICSLV